MDYINRYRIIIVILIISSSVKVCAQTDTILSYLSLDNQKDSVYIGYHDCGSLKEAGCYRLGANIRIEVDTGIDVLPEYVEINKDSIYVRVGKWKKFYQNGILEWEGAYYPGYIISIFKDVDSLINVEAYFTQINYVKEGEWLYYSEKGELMEVEYYEKGNRLNTLTKRNLRKD